MKKETAIEWLVQKYIENSILNIDDFQQANEMFEQQKKAYKMETPLGHVDHSIDTYGIDITITEYKVKALNNKDSSFWKECLAIAKFYKQFKNNETTNND